jgi:hypothetical protein
MKKQRHNLQSLQLLAENPRFFQWEMSRKMGVALRSINYWSGSTGTWINSVARGQKMTMSASAYQTITK